jgi:hypothetical protein
MKKTKDEKSYYQIILMSLLLTSSMILTDFDPQKISSLYNTFHQKKSVE